MANGTLHMFLMKTTMECTTASSTEILSQSHKTVKHMTNCEDDIMFPVAGDCSWIYCAVKNRNASTIIKL